MPSLATEAPAVMARCDEMHSLVTVLAVCAAQAEGHQGRGEQAAVEACAQTARAAIASLEEHLAYFRELCQ